MSEEEKRKAAGTEKKPSPFWTKIGLGVLKFFGWLLIIACLPALLFVGIYYLIHSPFERRIYKKSRYYRDLGIRYCWGITQDSDYLLYELCRRADLAMERRVYTQAEENGVPQDVVYYVWRRETETVVVLLPPFECVYYDKKKGEWLATENGGRGDALPLKEMAEYVFGALLREWEYPVKLLLDESVVDESEKAWEEPFFLVYGKRRKLKEALWGAPSGGLRWEKEDGGEDTKSDEKPQ